jgi:hypothetical protein
MLAEIANTRITISTTTMPTSACKENTVKLIKIADKLRLFVVQLLLLLYYLLLAVFFPKTLPTQNQTAKPSLLTYC